MKTMIEELKANTVDMKIFAKLSHETQNKMSHGKMPMGLRVLNDSMLWCDNHGGYSKIEVYSLPESYPEEHV